MKIALVFPTTLDPRMRPVKYDKTFLPPLIMAILDALTPTRHEVKIYNDIVEKIDFDYRFDLVGISAMTTQAPRAYQIADKFRSIGVKVIIGGVHASFMIDEAKKHADSVLIGESENIWMEVLADAENGRLKDEYIDDSMPDLNQLLIPNWGRLNLDAYLKPLGSKTPMMPIYTTRGCPYGCKFCSVTKYFGKSYRMKPIANVLKEIDAIDAESYFFVDDNIACKPSYSRELFKALIPKKVRWFSQISTTVLKNPDLIDLAAESGCFALLVGFESLDRESLRSMKKGFNKIEEYRELIARFRKAKIHSLPNVIFGFDTDTPLTFRDTVDFLYETKVSLIIMNYLTPLPGTELFAEMDAEGRILHHDWSRFDFSNITVEPHNLSASQLHELFWGTYRELYSIKNIIARTFHDVLGAYPVRELFEHLFYEAYFRQSVYSYNHPYAGGGIGTG